MKKKISFVTNKEIPRKNVGTKMNKVLAKVKRKMVRGHDDFINYYCIHVEDWDKIVKKEVEDER